MEIGLDPERLHVETSFSSSLIDAVLTPLSLDYCLDQKTIKYFVLRPAKFGKTSIWSILCQTSIHRTSLPP